MNSLEICWLLTLHATQCAGHWQWRHKVSLLFPSVRSGIKTVWGQSVMIFSAQSALQCSDIVDWVTGSSLLLNPPSPYTSRIQQPIPFLSCASVLDLRKVSALGSRVGWTPARNNEQMNKPLIQVQAENVLWTVCVCARSQNTWRFMIRVYL